MEKTVNENYLEDYKKLYDKFTQIEHVLDAMHEGINEFLLDKQYPFGIAEIIFTDIINILDEYKSHLNELSEDNDTLVKDEHFRGKLEDLGATFYRNAKESVYFKVFESLIFAYDNHGNRYNTTPEIIQLEGSTDYSTLKNNIFSFRESMNMYNVTARAKKYWKDIKDKVERHEQIKKEIEEIYSNSGVSTFSITYSEIAKEEKCAKHEWLIFTVVFAIIAFCLSGYSLFQLIITETEYLVPLSRLPFTLIFILAAIWTGNKYSQARRNHLIYRHLASTLSTYNAFEASVSDEHRSLLLFEIAKVLFPPPIDSRSENQKELGNMIDLVKAFNVQNIVNSKNKTD